MTVLTRSDARDKPERDDTRGKREAIIEAARTLFAKQGYEETTIAEIARVAGVGVGTVYLYFQHKRQILIEVSVSVNAALALTMQSPELLDMPIRQVPRLLIEQSFYKCRQNIGVMSLFQVNVPSPEEMTQLRSAEKQIADALDGYFQQVIERGLVPPFDTASYAQMLTGLVNTVLQQCFGVDHGEHEELYRERLIEMVERLFFGPPLVSTKEQTEGAQK
ncbi:MAG TPA: TetR/AcrR family transcriptional regulator [Ktedonobacterales bacterium]|nr:TetR/AcrR family transcriptional regulator [Ktedonobacterales bacterium]